MKAIPLRTFLFKTVEKDGKYSDVIATRGEAIDITEAEYKKFGAGNFQLIKKEREKEKEEELDKDDDKYKDESKKKSNR